MTKPYFVALDQGTSSCRAVAVDRQGYIRAQKSKLFSPTRPGKGLSEYDVEALWAVQQEIVQALLDEIGPEQVAALAVCSQRSTVVLWDKRTGRAVAPVLTWEDGRSLTESEAAPLTQAEVHAQTGLFKTPFFSASKIAWCLQHCPAAAQAAQAGTLAAAPVASYFIWKLTQGATFAVDPTLAQRTLLWDIHTGQWSETLCRVYGVPVACLPEIRPTAAEYGTYIYKGVSIPIGVCVADQQAAAAYYHLSAGQTLVNYGTGAFVLQHVGKKPVVLPGMLSSVAAGTSALSFLLEGPIFSAGTLLQWLRAQGNEFEDTRLDELCASAQHPVTLLPALGGLGAPYWDYQATFMTENASAATQPADWLAGAMQAVANRVADIIYYLRQHNYVASQVYVSGGLSRSTYLLQYQADILASPLTVCTQAESTALGSARLLAEYMGEAGAGQPLESPVFLPRLSPQQAQQRYQAWQQFVQRCRQRA